MRLLKYLGLAVVLFVIGFLTYESFWVFSMSLIHKDDVVFQTRIISGLFYSNLIFALSFGMIPMMYAIVEKITKVRFITNGLAALVLIIGGGILFWFIRLQMINSKIKTLSSFDFQDQINPSYDISAFYFEYYVLLGIIVGAVLAVFIFKKNNTIEK
jgi:hypothetical protein